MPDPARPADPSAPDGGDDGPARPDLVAVSDDGAPDGDAPDGASRDASRDATVSRRERRERLDALARAAAEQARGASRSIAELSGRVAGSRRGMARQTADQDRLRTELGLFARDLDALIARTHATDAPWAAAAGGLLADATEAFAAGELSESWRLLGAARRQSYDGRGRDELSLEAEAVEAQARRVLPDEEADRLAERLGALKPSDRLDRVRLHLAAAREEVDEAVIRRDQRARVAARQLFHVGVLLAALIAGGALAAWFSTSLADEGEALRNLDNYLTTCALGGLGVTLSLLLPWRRAAVRPRTLDFLHPLDVTFLRLVLGIGVAVAVVIVLQSDLQAGLDLGGVKAYPWAVAA
ncbi:MAG: hypothetical protein KDB10_06685, partial [Acidimicrobiales bacterium]|nr:hypothetical protein [Acidimicrobiales bacterium]